MRRRVFLCAMAGAMAGCLTQPVLPERQPSTRIAAFAFSGRLAVTQGERRHHLKIDWRHDAQRDDILLATPLGQGMAEITRDAAGATLQLADRRRYEAADWSELAEQAFGFRLPLAASPRWLLGDIPPPSDMDGWSIRILERESAAAHALPALIELERDDIHVRLKIDEWSELQ